MKTTFIYGLGMAIAGAVINFAFFFLGYHDSVEKLQVAQRLGLPIGLAVAIVGLILAIRARRAEYPAEKEFGYGSALGAGTLTGLWNAIFGAIAQVLYVTVVNPGFLDLVVDGEVAKLEAKGMGGQQLEQAEKMIRMFSSAPVQAGFLFIGGFLFCFVISLIVAAFIRRPAQDDLSTPPPLEA